MTDADIIFLASIAVMDSFGNGLYSFGVEVRSANALFFSDPACGILLGGGCFWFVRTKLCYGY